MEYDPLQYWLRIRTPRLERRIACVAGLVMMVSLVCLIAWAFTKDKPDWLDAVVKALAALAAAAFFLWKLIAGYQKLNLKLTLRFERSSLLDNEDEDVLVITASLCKGERGSVRLHDMQARVTCEGRPPKPLSFVGFERLSYYTDALDGVRKKIYWNQESGSAQFLSLPPGDSMDFACCIKVPRNAIATVEVAVLAVASGSSVVAQWRASGVSPPRAPESVKAASRAL